MEAGVRVGAASALMVLALGGCAPAAPGLPEGVEVQLVQQRSDVAARTAQLRVVNGSDAALVVTDIALDDPRFVESDSVRDPRSSTIPAGHTVDLRVDLPAVACGDEVDDAGEGRAVLTVEGVGAVSVPYGDPLDFVAPLHERECRAAAMSEVAEVALAGFRPSAHPDAAVLELAVTPTGGDGEIELVELRPTNLLQFSLDSGAAHPIGLRVAGGDAPRTIEVPLVPLRCDPHAVQEDKRGTVFTLEVRVDGEGGLVQLAADERLRSRILNGVASWCGF